MRLQQASLSTRRQRHAPHKHHQPQQRQLPRGNHRCHRRPPATSGWRCRWAAAARLDIGQGMVSSRKTISRMLECTFARRGAGVHLLASQQNTHSYASTQCTLCPAETAERMLDTIVCTWASHRCYLPGRTDWANGVAGSSPCPAPANHQATQQGLYLSARATAPRLFAGAAAPCHHRLSLAGEGSFGSRTAGHVIRLRPTHVMSAIPTFSRTGRTAGNHSSISLPITHLQPSLVTRCFHFTAIHRL